MFVYRKFKLRHKKWPSETKQIDEIYYDKAIFAIENKMMHSLKKKKQQQQKKQKKSTANPQGNNVFYGQYGENYSHFNRVAGQCNSKTINERKKNSTTHNFQWKTLKVCDEI